ncbi:SDR family NAD(P)-dependent oxidoreductase [Pseudoalteromonas sp. SCSIO 43201]|uniref:type I polyketide synthase n=1 Tax=Pseudoalteromonas sp. SCSIO 43201 TaxID=2822842 RepID=UPI0020760411|nr:type I polyketide synthase [Pseudoalteromonas sp. SCSIO 43201]USD27188.1 SDR family NAD(P)-dependent oxidoreductase [Pseudoalteromonas sp. SCSIO 43201]
MNNNQAATMPSNDIAVIGVSCRLPGDNNAPSDFHQFLLAGGNGITEIPKERWDISAYYDSDREKSGKMYVKNGGFLSGLSLFDAPFFGISPKEAPYIDPQQRWVLEATYEALENAGLDIEQLKGSDTSVFMGQFMHDFEQLQTASCAHDYVSSHSATGSSMTLTANRVSYCFDFHGTSLTLDTACSSSLVALDLACKAILNGDSRIALAGGVNLLLRPEMTMSICKASMLSPDGLCKSFSSDANGYVRSEGVAVVVLKKLADAINDHDPILAVIKASGTNQDGQTNGITVPNGLAQQRLLSKTLEFAGLSGQDIDYAEAHGTGTAVGDPIEVNALGSVLGIRDNKLMPCLIGSVKSNIGHTEPTAGLAGLIKTINAMNSGVIPKTLHCHTINPAINEAQLNIKVVTENTPWPDRADDTPRRAIVNSFGFGGTNANVVVEQATLTPTSNPDHAGVLQLFVSAKSAAALTAQVSAYLDYLAPLATHELPDFCRNSVLLRTAFKNRVVFTAKDKQTLMAQLEDFIFERPNKVFQSATSQQSASSPTALVFSGMGTTWQTMGKALYCSSKIFKQEIDKVDSALQHYVSWSLIDKMHNGGDEIHETQYAQPAIFACQIALFQLLTSYGIKADAIVGHSAGEVAASYCAGVYSFEDAIRIIYHRSRLQQTTTGEGKMLAVGISQAQAQTLCNEYPNKVSIAAINSSTAVTLAGDTDTLSEIAAQLDAEGEFAKFLNVDVPYHSPVMDKLEQPLLDALALLSPSEPSIALYSTVTGSLTQQQDWHAEYWPKNVREPVYFEKAINTLLDNGVRNFIEISPHAVLCNVIKQVASDLSVFTTPLILRNEDDEVQFAAALGALAVSGLLAPKLALNAINCFPNHTIKLPNYQWQHQSYWLEHPDVQLARVENKQKRDAFSDLCLPTLGQQLLSHQPIFQTKVNVKKQPYWSGHQVGTEVIYPGAAYVEAALQFARTQQPEPHAQFTLCDIEFNRPLYLGDEDITIETRYHTQNGTISLSSLEADTWHQQSRFTLDTHERDCHQGDTLSDTIQQFPQAISKADFYAHCHQLDMNYQAQFQSVLQCWKSSSQVIVEIHCESQDDSQVLLSPMLLDGAFQSFFQLVNKSYLPVKISEFTFYKKPTNRCFSVLDITLLSDPICIGDLHIYTLDGQLCVAIKGIELKPNTQHQLDSLKELKYHYTWQHAPVTQDAGDTQPNTVSILAENTDFSALHVLKNNSVVHITSDDDSASLIEKLQPYLSHTERLIVDVRHLANIEMRHGSLSQTVIERALVAPLHYFQAIQAVNWGKSLEIVIITKHSQGAGDTEINPLQSAIWGMLRVFSTENQQFKVTLLDIDAKPSSAETLNQLLLAQQLNDTEMAIRHGDVFVQKLAHLSSEACTESKDFTISTTPTGHYQWLMDDNCWVAYAQKNDDKAITPVRAVSISRAALSNRPSCFIYQLADHTKPKLVFANAGVTNYIDDALPFVSLPDISATWLTEHLAVLHRALALVQTLLTQTTAVSFFNPSTIESFVAISCLKIAGRVVHVIDSTDKSETTESIATLVLDPATSIPNSIQARLCYGAHIICITPPPTTQLSHDDYTFIKPTIQLDNSQSIHALHGLTVQIVELLNNDDRVLKQPSDCISVNALPTELAAEYLSVKFDTLPTFARKRHTPSEQFDKSSYLVTGGQGGIGLEIVNWLYEKGAKHIFVSGRSALSDSLNDTIQKAALSGCIIQYIQADISQYDDVVKVIEHIAHSGAPLKGVFHAAGVLKDATFSSQSAEHMYSVLAPKVNGAWYLHLATHALSLDYFVCFSSIAAIVGWAGQANYAAANAFMDGLCIARRQQGKSALSLNWGPWLEAGMAAQLSELEQQAMQQAGMYPLTSKEGIEELERTISSAMSQIGIFKVDWQDAKLATGSTVFSHFQTSTPEQNEDPIKTQLHAANSAARQTLIESRIKCDLATVLGLQDANNIESSASVFDYGLNSLMAIELKQRLQALCDDPLPASLVMKHDSVAKLTNFITTLYNEQLSAIDTVTDEQVVKVML